MIKIQNYMEKAIISTSRVMSIIASAIVVLMTLLVTMDVFLRFIFNSPIKGGPEFISFMMIIVVSFGLAHTQYLKGNVAVDILFDRLPQKLQAIINILISVISLFIVGLMTWQAFIYIGIMINIDRITPVLKIPIMPFQLMLAFGLLMLSVVLLLDLIKFVFRVAKR